MITEQYVSFETARMLKEAGFNVPCQSQYTEGMGVWNVEYAYDFNADDFGYSRPTQALAARWLRELHNYAVCVWYSKNHEKWFYAHGDMNNIVFDTDYLISEYEFDSYEEALEAGLKAALKLIKK